MSPTDKAPREWWVVETNHAYFIYEDEITAKRECETQAEAYGYAEIHHAKSDYDQLAKNRAAALDSLGFWKRCCDLRQETNDKLIRELHDLRAKSAWLVEILRFWANEIEWLHVPIDFQVRRAREALKKWDEEKL